MDARRAIRDGYPTLLRGEDLPIDRSTGDEWREALLSSMEDELRTLRGKDGVDPLVEMIELARAYADAEGDGADRLDRAVAERRERLGGFDARYTVEVETRSYEAPVVAAPRKDPDAVLHRRRARPALINHSAVGILDERPSKDRPARGYPVHLAEPLRVRPAEHM